MAAYNAFTFKKGEDAQIDFTIRTGDAATDPVVDITGWTFSFKVKRRLEDADPSVVPTATVTIQSAAQGQVRVVVAASELQAMLGDYQHALWRTNVGAKRCLSDGPFSVTDTVES